MRIILRIGGSVVASPINADLINSYASLLTSLRQRGHEIVAVVGGGTLAREFIRAAKEMGLDENAQDKIAISVSRLFAQLLVLRLNEINCARVVTALDEVVECLSRTRIIVMGGLKPGLTTDAVAAMAAERIEADLIVKGTDQDGVFDKDPRKHTKAIKLDHIFLDDLSKVFGESKHKAGIHQIIDPIAIEVLKRCRVKMVVVNGFQTANILAAVEGKTVGTVIE